MAVKSPSTADYDGDIGAADWLMTEFTCMTTAATSPGADADGHQGSRYADGPVGWTSRRREKGGTEQRGADETRKKSRRAVDEKCRKEELTTPDTSESSRCQTGPKTQYNDTHRRPIHLQLHRNWNPTAETKTTVTEGRPAPILRIITCLLAVDLAFISFPDGSIDIAHLYDQWSDGRRHTDPDDRPPVGAVTDTPTEING